MITVGFIRDTNSSLDFIVWLEDKEKGGAIFSNTALEELNL